MYEVLFLLIFTQQIAFKYKHIRNYRHTVYIYVNFLQKFNWAFWRKHSAFGQMYHTDTVVYGNNKNIIKLTKCITSLRGIILNQFFSMRQNRYISFISTEESRNYSLGRLWPSTNFYEREASEMFGIKYRNTRDSRRLLLDYSDYSNPLKKDYDVFGSTELRYTKYTDKPKFIPNTLITI